MKNVIFICHLDMSSFPPLFFPRTEMGTLIPLGLVGGRRAGCPFARPQAAIPQLLGAPGTPALVGSSSPGNGEVDRGPGSRAGQSESWEVACHAKESRKTSRSTRRRRRRNCCEPALPALLRPLPATAWHLNMSIVRAGSFPGAVNMLPISYKYFRRCPLA